MPEQNDREELARDINERFFTGLQSYDIAALILAREQRIRDDSYKKGHDDGYNEATELWIGN